jgi:ArsR family transcriptional regulator, arsenate/arsenite/antimonite-responsive transcriptional repressor
MRQFLAITKALSDQTRLRALVALRGGELCLCQLIGLLELAPSTVSKHLDLLHQAGLVERRKQGKWHYFRLAGRDAPPVVRQALRWTLEATADQPLIRADARKLRGVCRKDLEEVAACYRPNGN